MLDAVLDMQRCEEVLTEGEVIVLPRVSLRHFTILNLLQHPLPVGREI